MNFAVFGFQAVPPAPGRAEPSGPAQVAQPATAPEGGGAPPAGPEGFGFLFPLLIFAPLLILLWWSSRSQQKKQEAAISGLKKGDRVLTQSGLVGRLVEVDQRYAKVELAPGVKVQILKTSLLGRDSDEASAKKGQPADAKKA